jgi:hypothetical protein
MTNLAFLNQRGHRAHGVLDWHRRIDAMQVVEIDRVHAEAFWRAFAGGLHCRRAAVDAAIASRLLHDPEFRPEHGLVTPPLQRLSHFGFRVAVDVGGVEKRHTQVERAVNQGDRAGVVVRARGVDVGQADAHAAEPESGDYRAVTAEFARTLPRPIAQFALVATEPKPAW